MGQGRLGFWHLLGIAVRKPPTVVLTRRAAIGTHLVPDGAPVVPVAQWGAQDVLDTARSVRVGLRPRRPVRFRVGPPVGLSPWAGRALTADVLREATEAVMDAITAEPEALRGERAPAVRHESRPAEPRRTA